MSAKVFTRSELLQLTEPEDLYTAQHMQETFRALAKKWHPDKPGGDVAIFAKVSSLRELGEKKLADNTWNGRQALSFDFSDSHWLSADIQRSHDFVLGRVHISNTEIFHVVPKTRKELVANALSVNFKYGSDRMKKDIARYLPNGVVVRELQNGQLLISQPKTPDLLRLSDVVKHFGGRLEPKHAAWVISSLMNLCCYLDYANIVHGDISADTVYISPEHHSVALLGGWWFNAIAGEEIELLPRRTVDVLPYHVVVSKQATPLIDQELVRLLGREIITRDVGKAVYIKQWLAQVASGKAREQYAAWIIALEKDFGKRRFTKMDVTAEILYGGS